MGAAALLPLGASVALSGSHQATEALPGGTEISVVIDDPVSGTTLHVDPGDTADVSIVGSASIAAGVLVKDTTVVYILDLSGSMTLSAGVDCTGNGFNDSRLVCQREAVKAANQAAADPGSAIAAAGVGSFSGESSKAAHIVDLDPDGTALLVAPDHDGDGNGVPDIVDVVSGLTAGGFTSFADGLEAAAEILAESTTSINIVIFISDGLANAGDPVASFAGAFDGFGTTFIHTFAVSSDSDCTSDPMGLGSLNDVANLRPDGGCEEVENPGDLAGVITEAIGSTLDFLELSHNGAPVAGIIVDTPGPIAVDYSFPLTGLSPGDHQACVKAQGVDVGGVGSATACIDLRVVMHVGLDIKPGSDPNSINSKSQGVIPVAILSQPGFFAPAVVDRETLTFGRTGDEDSLHRRSVHQVPNCGVEDADGDGVADLVCKFRTPETGFVVGDTEGILRGLTLAGEPFEGRDSVNIVH